MSARRNGDRLFSSFCRRNCGKIEAWPRSMLTMPLKNLSGNFYVRFQIYSNRCDFVSKCNARVIRDESTRAFTTEELCKILTLQRDKIIVLIKFEIVLQVYMDVTRYLLRTYILKKLAYSMNNRLKYLINIAT